MAKEWHKSPAELIGVTNDPWVMWCVNEAVFMFGRHVDHEMDKAEGSQQKPAQRSAARQRALQTALAINQRADVSTKGQFRDPAEMVT